MCACTCVRRGEEGWCVVGVQGLPSPFSHKVIKTGQLEGLGMRLGELGMRLGELGMRPGELGMRLGELGMRLGELGMRPGDFFTCEPIFNEH